jgi:hypothetical protein
MVTSVTVASDLLAAPQAFNPCERLRRRRDAA